MAYTTHALPRGGADPETVEVGELARSVARGWRALLAGAVLGLALAAAVVLLFPPRYLGEASVLLRNANDPTSSLLSRFGIAGDLAGAAPGGGLGNVLKSPLETEVQILGSRDVLGQVVDSLGLQARVLAPRGVPSLRLIAPGRMGTSFRRRTFEFARGADGGYAVDGEAGIAARPGAPVRLPGVGTVTLAAGPLPERFRVEFEDREDAITRLSKRLDVDKAGGEVVRLDYAGPDSLTAAVVPNAVVAVYLERRRTIDRGLNQRRYEFLVTQADSAGAQLAVAENALRAQQERTGVFDPELSGRAGVDAMQQVREQLGALDAERLAVRRLVSDVERGSLTPRQLTAFPSFLKSEAMNSVLTQITQLETERTRLLERRTDRDPEVSAISQSVRNLERQLLPLGQTYAGSLDRQVAALAAQQAAIETRMASLPGQAEGALRRQRDVKRLSQTLLALQAQLVDVRLAAIGEGGQVRQVDVAQPPKRPSFPRPALTLLAGLAVGLVGGVVAAVARGASRARVHTPDEAERASGLPALLMRAHRPLLLGPGSRQGTVLVAAVGRRDDGAVRAVARQLYEHARERGRAAAYVDLAADAATPLDAARLLDAAEAGHEAVVVAADGFDDRRTGAVFESGRATLLVARAGQVRRAELADAAATLARLAQPCLGVVLVDGDVSAAAVAGPGGSPPSVGANGTRPLRADAAALAAGGNGAAR